MFKLFAKQRSQRKSPFQTETEILELVCPPSMLEKQVCTSSNSFFTKIQADLGNEKQANAKKLEVIMKMTMFLQA